MYYKYWLGTSWIIFKNMWKYFIFIEIQFKYNSYSGNADYTWETLSSVTEGNLLFTFPNTPIKCPGAPQKIMYLAESHLKKVWGLAEILFPTSRYKLLVTRELAERPFWTPGVSLHRGLLVDPTWTPGPVYPPWTPKAPGGPSVEPWPWWIWPFADRY